MGYACCCSAGAAAGMAYACLSLPRLPAFLASPDPCCFTATRCAFLWAMQDLLPFPCLAMPPPLLTLLALPICAATPCAWPSSGRCRACGPGWACCPSPPHTLSGVAPACLPAWHAVLLMCCLPDRMAASAQRTARRVAYPTSPPTYLACPPLQRQRARGSGSGVPPGPRSLAGRRPGAVCRGAGAGERGGLAEVCLEERPW